MVMLPSLTMCFFSHALPPAHTQLRRGESAISVSVRSTVASAAGRSQAALPVLCRRGFLPGKLIAAGSTFIGIIVIPMQTLRAFYEALPCVPTVRALIRYRRLGSRPVSIVTRCSLRQYFEFLSGKFFISKHPLVLQCCQLYKFVSNGRREVRLSLRPMCPLAWPVSFLPRHFVRIAPLKKSLGVLPIRKEGED